MIQRRSTALPRHQVRYLAVRKNQASPIALGILRAKNWGTMRHFLTVIPWVLICVGVLSLTERPAWAYADPGTGLLLIQAAGTAIATVGWFLRRKFAAIFRRGSATKTGQEVKDN